VVRDPVEQDPAVRLVADDVDGVADALGRIGQDLGQSG
jgi:hypothetical protein